MYSPCSFTRTIAGTMASRSAVSSSSVAFASESTVSAASRTRVLEWGEPRRLVPERSVSLQSETSVFRPIEELTQREGQQRQGVLCLRVVGGLLHELVFDA